MAIPMHFNRIRLLVIDNNNNNNHQCWPNCGGLEREQRTRMTKRAPAPSSDMLDYYFPLLQPHQFVIHMQSFIENSNKIYFILSRWVFSSVLSLALFNRAIATVVGLNLFERTFSNRIVQIQDFDTIFFCRILLKNTITNKIFNSCYVDCFHKKWIQSIYMWPFLVQHCVRTYVCGKIPMEKPSQLLRIKVPFILLHNIGEKKWRLFDINC